MPYIYKITNLINGKIYIGKTSHQSLEERFAEHLRDSTKIYREKRPLYEAFKKYGNTNFKIEPIEYVENDEIASAREAYWIKTLNTYIGFQNSEGYNATMGGDGKRLYDYKLLAEEYKTLGTLKAVVLKYGCDKDTVKQACEENNIFIAKAPNQRAIRRIDINNKIKIYNSISEAAKDIVGKSQETARKNISRALAKGTTGYGYKWEYIN